VFKLHPRLDADTFFIGQIDICNLYLMNDARYVWLILVPAIDNLSELHDLQTADYTTVMQHTRKISATLATHFPCDKVNIGALGNMVPQLHIHIIARSKSDNAWPAPVWGNGTSTPYSSDRKTELLSELKILFS